ncbi:hypothetical protein DSO57_1015150 [Entomophthora muscae]|uniref:Uncharacterized protein n=1 Tax=Entomophthora muscae TaxID=34485 RepID=A0ACC2URV6_9FUNG|nr:hypothetical protein DSO57_1015150 [Entomophthora muscae]
MTLEWAQLFCQGGVKKLQLAEEWRKTKMPTVENKYALENKIPLAKVKLWRTGGFTVFEAVEFYQAYIPATLAGELQSIPMAAERLSEYFSIFQNIDWAIGWARAGVTPSNAKDWAVLMFSLVEAQPWIKAGFSVQEARDWSYFQCSPELARRMRVVGWHPNIAAKWGPFTTWSPETKAEWRAQRWNPVDMKYWLNKGFTITDADIWKLLGITAHIHSNLGDCLISLEQWGNWRETSSITKAANWIEAGFTPKLVVKWMDTGISPQGRHDPQGGPIPGGSSQMA